MAGEPGAPEVARMAGLCRELARAAGRLVADERPETLAVAGTKSSETDVVTVMDRRSERLLREMIAARRPDDGVLGEEDERTTGRSRITWVIDPIDGTVNYLYGLPQYAVSVAACLGDPGTEGAWEPVAGAVYQPATDEMFSAARGAGATLQQGASRPRTLRVSSCSDLARALVATGFGYEAPVRARQGAVVAGLLPRVRDIRRGGSAALDLCAVAAGRLDAYYESGIHVWDLAAGRLVVTEAGGVVRGRDGGPPGKELTVAGPAAVADALAPLVGGLTAGPTDGCTCLGRAGECRGPATGWGGRVSPVAPGPHRPPG